MQQDKNQSQIQLFKHYKEQGDINFKARQYQKAIMCYTLSLQANPKYLDAYCNRSNAYYLLKQFKLSLLDCKYALWINPNQLESILRMAMCQKNLLMFNDAIKHYKQVNIILNSQRYQEEIEKIQNSIKIVQQYQQYRSEKKFRSAYNLIQLLRQHFENRFILSVCLVECHLYMKDKEQFNVIFHSFIRQEDQKHFLYWYLKSLIDAVHYKKTRTQKYILQAIRLRDACLQEIECPLTLYYCKRFEIVLQDIRNHNKRIKDASVQYGKKKLPEFIDILTLILNSDILSFKERMYFHKMRGNSHKELEQIPGYIGDLIQSIEADPFNIPLLTQRLFFYMNEEYYSQANRDAKLLYNLVEHRHKQLQARFEDIDRLYKGYKINEDAQGQEYNKPRFLKYIKKSEEMKKQQKKQYSPNYYFILLNVDTDTRQYQISIAYRKLFNMYNPEKYKNLGLFVREFAANKFRIINEAYATLMNRQKRYMYELYGHPDSTVKFDKKYLEDHFLQPRNYFRSKNPKRQYITYAKPERENVLGIVQDFVKYPKLYEFKDKNKNIKQRLKESNKEDLIKQFNIQIDVKEKIPQIKKDDKDESDDISSEDEKSDSIKQIVGEKQLAIQNK